MEKQTEYKPKRKLYQGFYWMVNLDWIKQEICKIYNGINKDDIERELIITPIKNSYGNIGTYVFSLMGSPPKGYAFYIPTSIKLIFIGMSGEKIKKLNNIKIKDLEKGGRNSSHA